jgi:hypothetical protein
MPGFFAARVPEAASWARPLRASPTQARQSAAHQVLVERVAVEQRVAKLQPARRELHVKLRGIELRLQVAPDVLLQHELEDPLEAPVEHRRAGSLAPARRLLPPRDGEKQQAAGAWLGELGSRSAPVGAQGPWVGAHARGADSTSPHVAIPAREQRTAHGPSASLFCLRRGKIRIDLALVIRVGGRHQSATPTP